MKNKKIAIIGAGLSGLACALRLASKKYEVTVFEKSDRIGGHLWDLLPAELFLKDIEQQFMYEQYTLYLDKHITDLDNLQYDSIYIATGTDGNDFGLNRDPEGAYASSKPGIFLGGSLICGNNSMHALADGLQVVNAIERYLKTGNMNQPHETWSTRLELDVLSFVYSEPVIPNDGVDYSREEAILEANRCLKCTCDACYRYCDLLQYFKKYPKRIEEEVELTIHPGTLDGNGTIATRFITTCNVCGLCKEVCPQGIDIGEFLLLNHRIMREKGAMPWVFHDFWLRDMDFSYSELAFLCRLPPGYKKSQYLFFPGCQLGASDPQYVIQSYHWLLSNKPDTALMLGCCGAPAEWAGDEKLHDDLLSNIRLNWNALGKPVVIFTCPTCKQIFQRYLPDIQCDFLYNLFLEWGASPPENGGSEMVSVFDPCSSREEPGLQQVIRDLVKRYGYNVKPLSMEGRLAQCCSWGGQVSIAHPKYAQEVIKNRITQNDNPIITYCINCRDIFASAQKPAYHILDIIFGISDSCRIAPTVSQRRNNRIILKKQALRQFWKEDEKTGERVNYMILHIPPEIKQKISNEFILETDIEKVIEHCEKSGRKIQDAESGNFIGHLQIGNMTYWAEYSPADNGYNLINAYCHRMSIGEA